MPAPNTHFCKSNRKCTYSAVRADLDHFLHADDHYSSLVSRLLGHRLHSYLLGSSVDSWLEAAHAGACESAIGEISEADNLVGHALRKRMLCSNGDRAPVPRAWFIKAWKGVAKTDSYRNGRRFAESFADLKEA